MNILYHHRSLADGAEGIHIREMVEAFQQLDHHVSMQAVATPKEKGVGAGGLLAGLRRRLPQTLFECAALALNVSDYVGVARRISSEGTDLLYKRHALLDVGAALAAKRRGIPVVLEVNTAYSAPSLLQFEPVQLAGLVRRAERRALRSASLVIAVSSPLASYLRELAGPDLPVLTLPNGVNPELFDPARTDGREVRTRYGLHDRFVVGWAGVLRRWHGVELLLDAMVQMPAAHLLLIGDGLDRPLLEGLARERGLAARLAITGRVPHDAMPAHLAALDVAVAADDRTGFASPMKIVEYMAMARPVLLPRLRNFEDLVQHDRTGLFFERGDALDLARGLRVLCDNPQVRERLGRAARARVEGQLNWRNNAKTVIETIRAGRAGAGLLSGGRPTFEASTPARDGSDHKSQS